jgi:glycosyltransferase involved in cell wall biosynthesis
MACGLPVVSFDCPSGPREILQHGRNGLLVPAEDAVRLAQTMQELMASKDARQRLGVAAHEVCERFSLSRVMGRWLDLLQSGGAPPAPGRGDPAPGARTTTV